MGTFIREIPEADTQFAGKRTTPHFLNAPLHAKGALDGYFMTSGGTTRPGEVSPLRDRPLLAARSSSRHDHFGGSRALEDIDVDLPDDSAPAEQANGAALRRQTEGSEFGGKRARGGRLRILPAQTVKEPCADRKSAHQKTWNQC